MGGKRALAAALNQAADVPGVRVGHRDEFQAHT